jgi:hypothetical protein
MYEVDNQDRVLRLEGVPQSSVGAPIPLVLADENRVVLAYYLGPDVEKNEALSLSVRVIDPALAERVALLRFEGCFAHMLGPPNDEASEGHPLAGRGLEPYAAFRVENSSWLRRLERMNRVHRYHRADRFWELQHLIFAFHDSTFECICKTFDVDTRTGSIAEMIPEMVKMLRWDE